ncbi:hypothetical protein EIZ39_05805 [Ammoniphilus sp. CFH 90114]|nr:hypothetical protein EIZ39_05805 [Ammoniphilus sp. CFH 90114]
MITTWNRPSDRSTKNTLAVSDCFATPVSWSPDGNRLAYLSGCGNLERASQIWVVDRGNLVP